MYTSHTWVADETITAEKLNHMESGIPVFPFSYASDSSGTSLDNTPWVYGQNTISCDVQGYVYGNPNFPIFARIINPDGNIISLYEAERYVDNGVTHILMSSPVSGTSIDNVFIELTLNDTLVSGNAIGYIR